MFRAHRALHQERQTSDLHTTQPPTLNDSYQRLYWHNLSPLMMSTMCSKHGELKINTQKRIVRHVGHLPRISMIVYVI